MPYAIRLPDGTLVENIPDEVTPQQAKARILQRRPDLAPKDRTWGEAATDIGAGLVSGVGSLAALPGQLYGLATGDMENVSTRAGEELKQRAEGMKSAGLKAREAERRRKIDEAAERGEVAAGLTAFKETITDPGLLLNFVAEQLPNLLPGLAAAKGVSLATKGAASLGTKTAAAVGAGATQQGADVGAGAYDRLVKELVAQGATEEEAAEGAINLARATGASAAVISVLANRYLPGGRALERVLAGGKTGAGVIGGAAAGAFKELPSEITEEVGGQLGANVAMRQIKPEQELTEGLGETAGMAAVGAVGMGGVTGAVGGRGAPERAPEQGERTDILRALQEREEASRARAEELAQPLPDDRTEMSRMLASMDPKDPRRKPLQEKIRAADAEAIKQRRAGMEQQRRESELAARSAFAQPAAQMEMRELGVVEGEPAPVEEEAPEAEPTLAEARAAGIPTRQMGLPFEAKEPRLRRKGEGRELPPEPPPEPAMGPLDPDKPLEASDLVGLLPPNAKKAQAWVEKNVLGKTQREVVEYVEKNPGMAKGNSAIAVALRELTAIAPAPYAEPTSDVRPESEIDRGGAESGVGAPVPEPGAAELATPAEAEGAPAPDGAGVGDLRGPATASAGAEIVEPDTVAPPAAPATAQEIIDEVDSVKTDEEYGAALEKLAAAWADPTRQDKDIIEDYITENYRSAEFKRAFDAADARQRVKRRMATPESRATVSEPPAETGLAQAVRDGDTKAALDYIADDKNASELDRLVAKRLRAMRSLPAIVEAPGIESDGQYNAEQDRVELRTVKRHTVLHEITHGAVHRLIVAVDGGLVENAGVDKLRAVYQHVNRVAPKLRGEYGMRSLTEFAAEAMSNVEFQAELQKIPYQRTSAFTAFARSVLTMLGIKNTSQNTALAEALIAVDTAILTGRIMQEAMTGTKVEGAMKDAEGNVIKGSISTPQLERIVATSELMQEQPGVLKTAYTRTLRALDTTQGLTPATRFRAYATDNMAGVAKVFDSVWGGKVRSSLGQVNPMVLLRDVQDFNKKMEAIYIEGSVEYSQQTGNITAVRRDGVPSMKDIWGAVKAWGAANNLTFDEAYATLSKMGEARRLAALRGTDVPIHKLSKADPRTADEQIDAMTALLAADKQAQDILAMLTKSREHFIDFMVDQGRLTKEEAAEWKSNIEYVPFDRIKDIEAAFRPSAQGKRGLAAFKDRPDLVGTESREVGNIFDNHLSLISWMATEGAKARATRHALYTMEALGAARKSRGVPTGQDLKKAVKTYQGGQEVWFVTSDPLFALAFRESAAMMAPWMKVLQQVTQVLRSTITLMPPFIASQVVQDIQRAMVASGVENPWALPHQIVGNFLKFAWSDITGKRNPQVEALASRGIAGGYDIDLQDPALSALQELGYRKRGPASKIVRIADGLLRASDLAVRAAIYKQTLKESNDAALATQRGREIINFRRRGASSFVSFMVSTVPFVNAYMQSMDLLYRNAMGVDNSMGIPRNEARARLMQQLATVAAFSMVYALAMSDDDEYNEMDLRERHKHFIIPSLNVKIPVPPEWAAVVKVPAEMFVEYTRKQGTPDELYAMEALKAVMGAVFEATAGPLPVPSAIRPILEVMTNFSFFTFDQIEGTYQKTLDPSKRTTYRTSEFSKTIAGAASELGFEVSPIMIDSLIQGYTATTGATLLAMTDAVLNPERMDRPLHKTFFLSTFLYDPVGARADREFYEFAERVMPKARTLNDLLKTNPEAAEAYATKHEAELVAAQVVGAVIQMLGEIRQYEKYLRGDQSARDGMTQEEREAELEALRRDRSEYLAGLREVKREYYAMKSATP